VQRDTSRNPLFDAVFSMQNANAEDLVMEGIELKQYSSTNVKPSSVSSAVIVRSNLAVFLSNGWCFSSIA
jgi:hypothetical protein